MRWVSARRVARPLQVVADFQVVFWGGAFVAGYDRRSEGSGEFSLVFCLSFRWFLSEFSMVFR